MSELFTKAFLLKFLKFGMVGFSGLFIDFGFTYLCKEVLRIQQYIANAIGFTIAASSNYLLNRMWTFRSTNPEIAIEYTEFILISIIGLGLNTLILYFVIKRFKWNFYLAKIVAIGFVTIWNFFANALFTFA